MIQDIAPHIYHNEYEFSEPQPEDYILGIRDGRLYMKESLQPEAGRPGGETASEPEFLQVKDLKDAGIKLSSQLDFLFRIDGRAYFLLDPRGSIQEREADLARLDQIPGLVLHNVSAIRGMRPVWKAYSMITAAQLHSWYTARRFCGRCGHPMDKSQVERALVCPNCGQTEYPKISPCVIVAVTQGDRILLTKYANRYTKNFALVAGFVEIGESLEDCVRREVMEEVGLKVKNLVYYKSQPWSFSESLLAGFYCQVEGSSEAHADGEELGLAQWFQRDEMPCGEMEISLTGEMIEAFRTKTYPGYKLWEQD